MTCAILKYENDSMEVNLVLKFGCENEEIDLSLFVLSVIDGINTNNELRIIVALSHYGETGSGAEDLEYAPLKDIVSQCRSIEVDEENLYEIYFENYVMYQVRNESYCSYDPYEVREGRYLYVYQRSRLLDRLQECTDCFQFDDGSYFPGKWRHYGIGSENHIIDIIATEEPIIRKIKNPH